MILHKTYDLPLVESITIPTDSASIAEGFRQTRIAHCNSCHGDKLTGKIYHQNDRVGKLVASNVTQKIQNYSDAELFRFFRHGIKKNGEAPFRMPIEMYSGLTDGTIKNIMAYLKTLEPLDHPELPGKSELKFFIRKRIAFKEIDLVGRVEALIAKKDQPVKGIHSSQVDFGSYLAKTACSNCHGKELIGGGMKIAPPLTIINIYSREQFHHMLRTGETLTKGDKGMMGHLVKSCFKYLHDEEVDAIYAFLNTLESPSLSDASLE